MLTMNRSEIPAHLRKFFKPRHIIKPKDDIGIPHRVAFALRDDGWTLRQDICWSKPNPLPESVRDRCTKAHEYIFMLSKSPRYYYDREAIAEPAVSANRKKWHDNGSEKQRGHGRRHAGFNGRYAERIEREGPPSTRNRRSVWTITTKPYKGAHFAVFPPEIPELCILAGSSERGQCRACGAPWVRVVERGKSEPDPTQRSTAHYNTAERYGAGNGGNDGFDRLAARMRAGENGRVTKGWAPSCACDAGDPVPQTILDPFGGSGTTAQVADKHGRHSILVELNPDNEPLIRDRLRQPRLKGLY